MAIQQPIKNKQKEIIVNSNPVDFFSENVTDVDVYTDGACSKNPGIGGWGVVILNNDQKLELHGGEPSTTNNRMEMMAAIEALQTIQNYKKNHISINLYTDSQYLKDGVESWIKKWKKNNWMTVSKKTVKNKELWEELDMLMEKLNVTWHWVPGHAGVKYNEEADMLARKFIIAQKIRA